MNEPGPRGAQSAKDREQAAIPAGSLDHVALAVPDLDAAVRFYREVFAARVTEPVTVSGQGIRMAYVELANTRIELMEPTGPDSPVGRYLERNPRGGIHHICMTTEDPEAAADAARARGMRLVAAPARGHHGRKLFFLHPADTIGTLIEIEEPEPESGRRGPGGRRSTTKP